jgi:hypothetical protein
VLRRVANAGFEAVVLVPGDPRALDVVVPFGTRAGDCSLFHPQVTVVRQGAAVVVLRAGGYVYLPRGRPGQRETGFACRGAGARAVRVRLAAPLGRRAIADALRGSTRVVPLDPRDYPAPRYLPAGYRLRSAHPVSAARGWLVAVRSYAHRDDVLQVHAGLATEMDGPLAEHLRHVDIDGHVGLLSLLEAARCVTWPVRPGIDYEVCVYPGRVNTFSTAMLLRVARSMH